MPDPENIDVAAGIARANASSVMAVVSGTVAVGSIARVTAPCIPESIGDPALAASSVACCAS